MREIKNDLMISVSIKVTFPTGLSNNFQSLIIHDSYGIETCT